MDSYTITIAPNDDSGATTTLIVDTSAGDIRITDVHLRAPGGLTGGTMPTVDFGLLLQAVGAGPAGGAIAVPDVAVGSGEEPVRAELGAAPPAEPSTDSAVEPAAEPRRPRAKRAAARATAAEPKPRRGRQAPDPAPGVEPAGPAAAVEPAGRRSRRAPVAVEPAARRSRRTPASAPAAEPAGRRSRRAPASAPVAEPAGRRSRRAAAPTSTAEPAGASSRAGRVPAAKRVAARGAKATPVAKKAAARAAKATPTAKKATTRAAKAAPAPATSERQYRRMPEAFRAAYAENKSPAALAERFDVPRYTVQGWIRRVKSGN